MIAVHSTLFVIAVCGIAIWNIPSSIMMRIGVDIFALTAPVPAIAFLNGTFCCCYCC